MPYAHVIAPRERIAARSTCPEHAVFLRLAGEIRAYPSDAAGAASPCTDVAGPKTLLDGNGNGYGAIVIDAEGRANALAFQSNGAGGLLIFRARAGGNASPVAAVNVDQDHVALATDASLNDYVVASQGYQNDRCWYVVPKGATSPSLSNCNPNVSAIYALATEPSGKLVTIGFDVATAAPRIDFFTGAATAWPELVRTIEGSATQLPAAGNSYFANSFALTTDPRSGNSYVYAGGPSLGSSPSPGIPYVLEFAAGANGNVKPLRKIGGAHTGLPASAFAADVIAVDRRGLLYVSTSLPSILVFGSHQRGDGSPERTITDPGAAAQQTAVGIAVRT